MGVLHISLKKTAYERCISNLHTRDNNITSIYTHTVIKMNTFDQIDTTYNHTLQLHACHFLLYFIRSCIHLNIVAILLLSLFARLVTAQSAAVTKCKQINNSKLDVAWNSMIAIFNWKKKKRREEMEWKTATTASSAVNWNWLRKSDRENERSHVCECAYCSRTCTCSTVYFNR